MHKASAARLWLCAALVGIGGSRVVHAQAAAPGSNQAVAIGVVVDTHAHQFNVTLGRQAHKHPSSMMA